MHYCVVPGCKNSLISKPDLSFHRLPLKRKGVLRVWMHKITTIQGFVVTILLIQVINDYRKMSILSYSFQSCQRRLPCPQERQILQRYTVESTLGSDVETEDSLEDTLVKDVSTNTGITYKDLVADLESLKKEVHKLMENIASGDGKISFYTGFPNLTTLEACYKFLGPAVNELIYWNRKDTSWSKRKWSFTISYTKTRISFSISTFASWTTGARLS